MPARLGNKKFAKATEAEQEHRIQHVERLLRTGPLLKHELRQEIKKKFNIEWRQAEEYITRARSRLLLHVQKLKEEHRADSVAWWEGNLLDTKASRLEKQNARKQIDDLLGLRQPTQIEHSGAIVQTTVDVSKLNLPTETLEALLTAVKKKSGD
jgi:hypothetical protein